MKKLSILSALCGLGFVGMASAADISIYYSPSCPHCHHARDFIGSTLIYEYPNLKVTEINVTDAANQDLFAGVLKKCEYERGGVPVLVIGEKCFQGYGDSMQDDLRAAIEADLTDTDKATAAENKKALADDPEKFKAAHSDRVDAVSEYSARAATDEKAQKKSKPGENVKYFYILLVLLVAALGGVLLRKDNKK